MRKKMIRQKTLKRAVVLEGVGLHSGKKVSLRLLPSTVNTGLIFKRVDLETPVFIEARSTCVTDTLLCTKVSNEHGVSVGTIEHLMAALAACEIDNILIEISGPEVPVLDGSSAVFTRLIEEAGIAEQLAPRRFLKILKSVTVESNDRQVTLSSASRFEIYFEMQFNGRQGILPQSLEMLNPIKDFKEELSGARTFGFAEDVEKLRAAGLALGGSLENAVVIEDGHVLNPEGLRFEDEFVRHKALDAIGDLYLAGGPLLGRYEGINAGHEMNHLALEALLSDETAWTWITLEETVQEEKFSWFRPKPLSLRPAASIAF